MVELDDDQARATGWALPQPLHVANEGLAFLLELVMLAGLAWWGWEAVGGIVGSIALAVLPPRGGGFFWWGGGWPPAGRCSSAARLSPSTRWDTTPWRSASPPWRRSTRPWPPWTARRSW